VYAITLTNWPIEIRIGCTYDHSPTASKELWMRRKKRNDALSSVMSSLVVLLLTGATGHAQTP
jgi:hypothetical protein